MKRIDFIIIILKKYEELREKSSKNRLCLDIYQHRINFSVELKHYYNGVLQKWTILTSNSLESDIEQQKIIEYLN